MTACLRTGAATSTPLQRKKIAIEAKRRGLDLQTVRDIAGVASLKELSSESASALISRICGQSLPNPPGQKPRTYKRRRHPLPAGEGRGEGATRMITNDQVEQIERLGVSYFWGKAGKQDAHDAFAHWLLVNFKVLSPRGLATTKRAGEVIAVLKGMIERKSSRPVHGAGKRKDSHASL